VRSVHIESAAEAIGERFQDPNARKNEPSSDHAPVVAAFSQI
jgi:hypothetical protein